MVNAEFCLRNCRGNHIFGYPEPPRNPPIFDFGRFPRSGTPDPAVFLEGTTSAKAASLSGQILSFFGIIYSYGTPQCVNKIVMGLKINRRRLLCSSHY